MRTRILDKAWHDFVAWCQARGLRPLPAHPWAVAAYARWCQARRRRHVTIENAVEAIAQMHARRALRRPDSSVIVRRTLVAIRDNVATRRAALFAPEDFLRPATTSPRDKDPGERASGDRASPTWRGRVLRSTPRLVAKRRYETARG